MVHWLLYSFDQTLTTPTEHTSKLNLNWSSQHSAQQLARSVNWTVLTTLGSSHRTQPL